jgi:flagellin-like hook-associated protein FlgL
MRVSSNQMLNVGVGSMQRHASDAINYQQQISTGNKYSKASQDATALARGVEIQFDQSRYGMLKKNQDFISTRMAMADAQLGSIHDVLTSMQEIAVRARGPALGVPGLTAIAQQARQNYEHLKNLSVAMDTNDDRYLLRMTSEAQLSVPKTTVTGSGTTAAVISSETVFRRSGDYRITADPSTPASKMRLQIAGSDGTYHGPDGTAGTFYVGDLNSSTGLVSFRQELNGRFTHKETDSNGVLIDQYTYPRQPDAFLDFDVTLTGVPAANTRIDFTVAPVTVALDKSARVYSSGDYEVRLTNDGTNYTAALYSGGNAVAGKVVDVTDSDGNAISLATLPADLPRTVSIDFEDFGSGNASHIVFDDLALTLTGNWQDLAWSSTPSAMDTITFSVEENVKQIEIEPGVWVPEGISFREAFGNAYNFNDERSRNVLRDALLFVESLERSAQSGALEAGFVDRQNDIIQSTDQIMQYRMRAGAIDAQNDLARSALETKMTELQVHKGRLLDTDVAEASAGLVRAQSLLEAARSIFSRLESSNLFNRLG